MSFQIQNEITRYLYVLDELESARDMIRAGFRELQHISEPNTIYHIPHQLLASGFERLMKCYILLIHEGTHETYPNVSEFGHDLHCLVDTILRRYFGGTYQPEIKLDYKFLENDPTIREILNILTLFGKAGRYFGLDSIADTASRLDEERESRLDPDKQWRDLEWGIEDPRPYINNRAALERDYFPVVHSTLIASMERFVRAIARQWTLGDHEDKVDRIALTAPILSGILIIPDDMLGRADYRSYFALPNPYRNIHNKSVRSEETIMSDEASPARAISRAEFDGDWPFRSDRVIVQLVKNVHCIVNISGYDFALNGIAKTLGYPDVYDAGAAVLGKSVTPFVTIALSLRLE